MRALLCYLQARLRGGDQGEEAGPVREGGDRYKGAETVREGEAGC